MAAGRTCWVHDEGDEHVVDLLVGVRTDSGVVVPADLRCARRFPDNDILPATDINVEQVRS